ncbi:MAG: DUF58 domain-containing protein [Propionicimonas sp.]
MAQRVRARSGAARSWLSRRTAVVTPLGWGVLTIGLLAGVVAVALGWTEFAAVAATLLLAMLAAIGFVIGRPSYRVEVDLASARVVVGERAVGELRIRATGKRPVAANLIELPVGHATATFQLPRLSPDEVHEELFTIPTQRRAVLRLGPVRSVRSDPIGLLRRQVSWTEPEDIYVHPRTIRLANDTTGLLRDLEGLTTRDISNDDVAFHALREYTPGDDLRHVHWRSTARVGQLMIRQFEETRRSQLVVLVSTRPADYASTEEYELGISIAASLGVSALVDGKDVIVFSSDDLLADGTPQRQLDSFSAIEESRSELELATRAQVIAADAPGASVVALVTGSGTPVTQLRLASLRVPPTARCFGVRAAVGEELGRRGVGDLAIATVPRLEDLPLAIRAVTA